MTDFPKVLIISHNIFENTNNIGKTLISLFQGWPKDKICQIYLRSERPSFVFCNDYYRITDKEIIQSYFKGKNVVGTPFSNAKDASYEKENTGEESDQKYYSFGNKRIPLISFARDIIWKRTAWKNDKLNEWLSMQRPDVILFVPNDYQLIYPIATYVSQRLGIPIVPYFMDDAFYYGLFVSPIDYLRRRMIRKSASVVLKTCDDILTIGPKMSSEYERRLKKNCIELMNSVYPNQAPPFFEKKDDKSTFELVYAGNLHSNRWRTIIKIGEVIRDKGLKIRLKVYTKSALTARVQQRLSKTASIQMCGGLKPDEVEAVLKRADGLLFVESFDRKSKASTKYSLSTKIPEYLNSHKPILAYGPGDISSIDYLRENKLAITCSRKRDIASCLTLLLQERHSERYKFINDFVVQNHSIEVNREKMKQVLLRKAGETN